MHIRTRSLAATTFAAIALAVTAPAFAQDASALPAAPSAGTLHGAAHITTSGMIATDLVLPLQASMTKITDSGYELRFQDELLDTLNITLTTGDGVLTDSFVGVGVPGTSIFEPAYFADFLHSQCQVTTTSLEPTDVAGSIECTGLDNGDASGTIDLSATFSSGAIATPQPSASPGI